MNEYAIDTEDTRESLEEDVHVWCALYPAWTYAGKFRNKVFEWLDRQATITEHNCQTEYKDKRDYLQKQVDKLRDEVEHSNKALEAYRSVNALLRGQNMELRRIIDTRHEYAAVNINDKNMVVDMSGVPIYIGDVLTDGEYTFTIDNDNSWNIRNKNDNAWATCDTIHHSPTVEDMLTEFAVKLIERGELTNGAAQTIAEYAAKLQLKEDV